MRSRYLIWSLANTLHLLEVTWLNWTFSPQPTFSLLADLGRSAPEGSTSSGSTSKGPTHMLRIVPWLIHSFYHRSAKTSWNPYHPCWCQNALPNPELWKLNQVERLWNWHSAHGTIDVGPGFSKESGGGIPVSLLHILPWIYWIWSEDMLIRKSKHSSIWRDVFHISHHEISEIETSANLMFTHSLIFTPQVSEWNQWTSSPVCQVQPSNSVADPRLQKVSNRKESASQVFHIVPFH